MRLCLAVKINLGLLHWTTNQLSLHKKIFQKFSIKDFFSKCYQIRSISFFVQPFLYL